MHCEAEKAMIGLESGRVGPDRCILLPQQRGEARQDLDAQKKKKRFNPAAVFLSERKAQRISYSPI